MEKIDTNCCNPTTKIFDMGNAPTRSFESGRFFEYNGLNILDLHGSWYEMGRQYGFLAAELLHDVYQNFMLYNMERESDRAPFVQAVADKLYRYYPHRLRQLFSGMAETSGLTLEQLKTVNVVEFSAAVFNCSAMAVWDDYAAGNLVYGRNYDAPGFQPLGKDVLLTAYHPSDGSLATATIGYAGEIYAVNGLNEKGIFLELNNGMPSGGTEILYERLASTTELMMMLLDADSLDYADAFLRTVKGFASYTIGIADAREARSYEWCARGVARAPLTADGLMVMTNHYVSDEWDFAKPDDEQSWGSLTRCANLKTLAEQSRGTIDASLMRRIMQTPIKDGGPGHDCTVYQIVIEPQTMMLWMQVAGVTSWQQVDMGKILLP